MNCGTTFCLPADTAAGGHVKVRGTPTEQALRALAIKVRIYHHADWMSRMRNGPVRGRSYEA